MALDLQYDIVNDTPANATPVDANFNRLEQFVNQECIRRDGVVAMTAQLRLVGDPVGELDATTKQYVDQVLPVGIIMMYGGTATPPGGRWAVCNGAEVETVTYPELFAVIGNNFTTAPVAGRFNLPSFGGRIGIGAQATTPTIAIGATGGSRDSVVPAHNHPIDHTHPAGTSGNDSPDHAHGGIDHLHRVDIWTGGQNAGHYHGDQGFGQYVYDGVGGSYSLGVNTVGANHILSMSPSTNWGNADHAHAVNGWSGAADRSLTTHGATARHAHSFQTPTFSGASGSTGVAATDANLPPYVGIQYIIRVR